ncbi:hypothetical protein TNCV_4751201 [Trichonephila clavipes]|nr:hypothetical protein TNCV_4751201 [Trichonephila clavipes]
MFLSFESKVVLFSVLLRRKNAFFPSSTACYGQDCFSQVDLFDVMFFHRLSPKSFNHFSTLFIRLVLGLPLYLFPSEAWKIIFLTGFSSLYRNACPSNLIRKTLIVSTMLG